MREKRPSILKQRGKNFPFDAYDRQEQPQQVRLHLLTMSGQSPHLHPRYLGTAVQSGDDMKKVLITLGLMAITALSGCAVVPAYGPRADYEPAPYYGPRPYFGPPAIIVPPPLFFPRYGHHRGYR